MEMKKALGISNSIDHSLANAQMDKLRCYEYHLLLTKADSGDKRSLTPHQLMISSHENASRLAYDSKC